MNDFWSASAAKLKAELETMGIELTAPLEEIVAKAGGWFAALSDNEKTSVIATMRSYQQMGVTSTEFADLQLSGKRMAVEDPPKISI